MSRTENSTVFEDIKTGLSEAIEYEKNNTKTQADVIKQNSLNLTRTSKKLSFLLRHSQDPLYIDLQGGWADVSEIMRILGISRAVLDEIVVTDEKGRYSFDITGQRIRANQGHSIPGVVIDMEQPDPPECVYHGTATCFLDNILRDGLKPMNRQYVHISTDYETAVKVGSRHGKPVVLKIRAKEFVGAGNKLFRFANGVWQAESVPSEYFEVRYIDDNTEDIAVAEEAYKEYLQSGMKSRPVGELWKELGL